MCVKLQAHFKARRRVFLGETDSPAITIGIGFMNSVGALVSVRKMPREEKSRKRDGRSLLRSDSSFVLQWGCRKRLRCIKDRPTNNEPPGSRPVRKRSPYPSHRVFRYHCAGGWGSSGTFHFDLRDEMRSIQTPTLALSDYHVTSHSLTHRHEVTSMVRGACTTLLIEKSSYKNNNNENNHSSGGSGSSESYGDTLRAVWLPKFVIGLTNKEKEEDYMAIKGSKLPQRPKKRAKFIQRTLNLVTPGAWLCDLSLDRYEVQEKKVSKKRPRTRGLKGMGNMNIDSDSD